MLFAPIFAGMASAVKRSFHMNVDHRIPLLLGHVENHPVTQNAGVVDENIELAEAIERALDDTLGRLEIGDAFIVGYGFTAGSFDFLDNLLGGAGIRAGAIEMPAEIVDHNLSTVFRQ